MAVYQVLVADLITGRVLGEIPATAAKWSHVRNAPGQLDVTVSITQPPEILVALGATIPGSVARIGGAIVRDGVIVAGGVWWTWDADFSAGTLSLHGEGWHSYVRRRTLRANLSYTDRDQTSVIAKALVDYTQTPGQTPTIDTSGVVASGQLRDRTWLAGERNNVGQLLEDLAATENGFSFRYDTVRVGDALQARFITGPDVGRKTPLVFEEGKNITTLSAQGDGTAVVTHVDGVGAGEGDAGLRTTQANAGLIGVYPLLDDVESHTDVSILSTLAGYARRRLARGKAPVVLPKIAVNPAADPVLGSYTVGDVVRVRSGYGLVTVDDPYLIVQIDGTLDRSGGEKVEITYAVADAFTTI
ncbi:MAG TPA: hypothetical protein VIS06_16785 [Mycobacteriales bacterium]